MTRLSRLTYIITHLQANNTITAQELADKFEVSKRTIYRDMETLIEAGIPIGAENGVGYFLVNGYTLPPISLTEQEANTLTIFESFVKNQGDISLQKNFDSLLLKIKATLKPSQKESITSLDAKIAPSVTGLNPSSNSLSIVQESISKAWVINVKYHSIYKDEVLSRNIEPLGVYFTSRAWIVIAYCQLRKAIREFRLDRILSYSAVEGERIYKRVFDLNNYFQSFQN